MSLAFLYPKVIVTSVYFPNLSNAGQPSLDSEGSAIENRAYKLCHILHSFLFLPKSIGSDFGIY